MLVRVGVEWNGRRQRSDLCRCSITPNPNSRENMKSQGKQRFKLRSGTVCSALYISCLGRPHSLPCAQSAPGSRGQEDSLSLLEEEKRLKYRMAVDISYHASSIVSDNKLDKLMAKEAGNASGNEQGLLKAYYTVAGRIGSITATTCALRHEVRLAGGRKKGSQQAVFTRPLSESSRLARLEEPVLSNR